MFSIITPSLQWFFRNHSNILIYCSRNTSDYHQCWKQLCNCEISPDDSHILISFRKCYKITCLFVCPSPMLSSTAAGLCCGRSERFSSAPRPRLRAQRHVTPQHSTGQSQNTAVWWHALPLLSSRSSTLDASLPLPTPPSTLVLDVCTQSLSLSQLLTSTASWETTCLYSVTGVSSFCPFMCHSTLTSLGPEGKLHLHVDPTGYLALTQCEQDSPIIFIHSCHTTCITNCSFRPETDNNHCMYLITAKTKHSKHSHIIQQSLNKWSFFSLLFPHSFFFSNVVFKFEI